MDKNLILVNPHWQGGGEPSPYYGALELKDLYLADREILLAPAGLDPDLPIRHDIKGYDALEEGMTWVAHQLQARNPRRIFALGGSCDADLPVIAYLNQLYQGELLVLWVDAHGDLNAPEESGSKLFYGMPARVLMGGTGLFPDIVTCPLTPAQLIQLGGRDLDEPEIRFIQANGIRHLPDFSLEDVRDILEQHGNRPVYLHLDLDVLDPKEFSHTPLPVPGGVSQDLILAVLTAVAAHPSFVGLGVYEYTPCGEKNDFIQSILNMML